MSPSRLYTIARFVRRHGHTARVYSRIVRIGIDWTNPRTGESGTDYFNVRGLHAAKCVLGY